ncbi:hypothetical protein N8Z26_05910 [Burkholderiales bacterium]|nr:hypothetical protein [Burkholderiales bacterium]
MKSAVSNALVILIATLLSLALLEVGAWIWVNVVRDHQLSRWEFRATQPPPYQNADYFSERFLKESETFVNGRLADVVKLDDYHGEYFNVTDGYRVTKGAPPNSKRRILLFGGSTLFGQEVPDEHTIASHLQRMVNDAGLAWTVSNYGLPGMDTSQQVSILKTIPLREEDIVIFYHGVNDIYYVVFGGASEGWRPGVPNFRPIQELSSLAQWMKRWHERLKNYSHTADLALDIFDRSIPATISNKDALALGVELSADRFRMAVQEAQGIVLKSSAEFEHYLQPTIFNVNQKSRYERGLLAHYLETPPGVDIAFANGYPKLREVSLELQLEGVSFMDITDVLDQRHEYDEVFLDFCHLNHVGNRLIAERIYVESVEPRANRR